MKPFARNVLKVLSFAVLYCGISTDSKADIVPGNFEARVGSVLVKVKVASGGPSTKTKALSGSVVKEGEEQSLPATAVLIQRVGDDKNWDYAETGVAGLDALKLVYDSSADTLEVTVGASEIPTQALHVYRPEPNQTVAGTYVVAYRIDNTDPNNAFAAISGQYAALSGGTGVFQTVTLPAEAAAKANLDLVKDFKMASEAMDAAKRSLKNEIVAIFKAEGKLRELNWTYAEAAATALEGFEIYLSQTAGERDVLDSQYDARVQTDVENVTLMYSNLISDRNMALADSVWDAAANSALTDLGVYLDPLLPDSYAVSGRKALVKQLWPKFSTYVGLIRDRYLKSGAYARKYGDPALALEDPTASYLTAKSAYDWAYGAAEADRKSIRVTQSNKLLVKYQGYGWAALSFTAWDPSQTSGGAIAKVSGVSPDGTPWVSAAALCAEDTVGTRASLALNTAIPLGSGSASLVGVYPVVLKAGTTNVAGKSLVNLSFSEGLSSAVLRMNRMKCRTEGPIPVVASSGTANILGRTSTPTSLTVVFSDPVAGSGITGFGAQLKLAAAGVNAVEKLLVLPQGSDLKVTGGSLSSGSAAFGKFSGSFIYPGTSAAADFQGIFVPSESGSVKGFGSIKVNSGSSVVAMITEAVPSPDEKAPSAPTVPQSVISWGGLKTSLLKINVGTSPAPNKTTVKLIRGSGANEVEVATALADANGEVSLATMGATSGSDYRIRVSREFVSGTFSVTSDTFAITQREIPAGVFQSLLRYQDVAKDGLGAGSGELGVTYNLGACSPNGNPYRARVRLTTTVTGAVTGNLELVDLNLVLDEVGNAAPSWVAESDVFPVNGGSAAATRTFLTRLPALVSYTLTGGTWTPSTYDTPNNQQRGEPGLAMSIPILLSTKVDTGHRLNLFLRSDNLDNPVELGKVSGDQAPLMEISLVLSGSAKAGGAASLFGNSTPAAMVLTKAAGTYTTGGTGLGWKNLRSVYTWQVGTTQTVSYTWKRGTAKGSGSAYVGSDGKIPFFCLVPSMETGTLVYPTGAKKASGAEVTASSKITMTGVGIMDALLSRRSEDPPIYALGGESLAFFTGASLESGRFKKAWNLAATSQSYTGPKPGGFGWSEWMLTNVPYKLMPQTSKIVAGQEYDLRIENTRTGESSVYTVKFALTGTTATVTSVTPSAGTSVVKRLTLATTTGVFSGSFVAPWTTTTGTASGNYVRDDSSSEPNLCVRGVTTDPTVVWSLYKK